MVLRPVMLAHLRTKKFEFRSLSEYNGYYGPVGGTENAALFYEYMHVYLDKIRADLKRIGMWSMDSSVSEVVGF